MTKFLFCSAILFSSLKMAAQGSYEEIAGKFLLFYNAEMPDSIFALYTAELKERLSLEKTKAVISGLHVQFGNLRSLSLLKQDSGFNMYKAGFAHQTLMLLLSLSKDSLIEGYRLVPYNKEQFTDQNNKDYKH